MGNAVCCEQEPKKQFDHTITVIHKQDVPQIPQLNQIVQAHLEREKPFQNQLPTQPIVRQFGNDIYEGSLDERGRPNGFGKMYHKNGSVFIGQFYGGMADGFGHFVKPDGSYYHGRLKNNMANDNNGYYWSPKFEYRGSVVDNEIQGRGKQKGQRHTFQGNYRNGHKVDGILRWREDNDEFEYEGSFNEEGNFDGRGRLWQKNRGQYIGDFVNGNKHGNGEFMYLTGSKYMGEYYHGYKDGKGKLYDHNGKLIYQGEFKNNMPHGAGFAPDENGKMVETQWIQGIDKFVLDQ